MITGWVKLHRQFLDWEWYDDMNTKCLFLHLLLRANHSDSKWRGIEVKRGQLITSLDSLASETGLSVQKIRTSINKLKSTGSITSKQQAKARIITVVAYDSYQDGNKEVNRQAAGKQQDSNREATPDKNVRKKECKNDKNKVSLSLDYSAWHSEPSEQVLNDWLAMRKRLKANVTQTVISRLAKQMNLAVAGGMTADDVLGECIVRNWRGFEYAWLTKNNFYNQHQPQQTPKEFSQ